MKVVHALPDWSWRKTIPGHGAWKDIMGRLALWRELGVEVDVVDVQVERPESLLDRLVPGTTDLVFDYTHWPELLEQARAVRPSMRVHVRAHNAETLQHWHRRVDSWTGLRGRARLVWGTILTMRRDRRVVSLADTLLGISEWDNSHYWRRIPGKAEVLNAPYFCPWPDLGAPAVDVPWSERRRAVACMPAGRSPIERAQIEAFVQFAQVGCRLAGSVKHEFLLTNALWREDPDVNLPDDVSALGDVEDPWGFMQQIRAVALLSPRGFGAKTTLFDAIEAGCHVIVAEGLASRLPREVRRRCLVVEGWSDREVTRVLDGLEKPPAPSDVNLRMKAASRAALALCLSAQEREKPSLPSVPHRIRMMVLGSDPSEESRVVEPGLGITTWPAAQGASGFGHRRPWTRGGTAILMYHGVVASKSDDVLDRYAITERTLRDHLRLLKRRRVPIPLETLVEALESGGRVDPRWIVVTLDDALRTQATRGAEILDAEKVPWALCVPAGLVGTRRSIWSYELAFLILECWEEDEVEVPGGGPPLPIGGKRSRERALHEIRSRLLPSPRGEDPRPYLDRLLARHGLPRFRERLEEDERFVLASWEEIQTLRSAGVGILAHGFTHLPHHEGLTEEVRALETDAARQELVARVGECGGFALPHGVQASWTRDALRRAGYRVNLTSRPEPVRSNTDLLDLPRLDADLPISALEQELTASL